MICFVSTKRMDPADVQHIAAAVLPFCLTATLNVRRQSSIGKILQGWMVLICILPQATQCSFKVFNVDDTKTVKSGEKAS